MAHRIRTAAIALAAILTINAAPAGAQPDTGLFLSIMPPGQSGHMSVAEATQFLDDGSLPPHIDDQRQLYEDLSFAAPGITEADLLDFFKPGPIAPATGVRASVPLPRGTRLSRDAFGVPHIDARTRHGAYYTIGVVSAEDRMFSMDLARRAGRGRISEFIGPDPFALSQDEGMYQFAGYAEEDLQNQIDTNRGFGVGRRVLRDLESFVAGINAFIDWANANPLSRAPAEYVGLGLLPIERFTLTDIVSVATQLEQLFGSGGGGEHRNSLLLQRLRADLGETAGRELYDDLRHREEPEASVTTDREFPYLVQRTIDPAAVADIDPGSLVQDPIVKVTGPLPPRQTLAFDLSFLSRAPDELPSMSNFLAVTAENAEGGHPIAVMGPQTGYFAPELLYEFSVKGAGLNTRGVAPSGSPYVVLGRGKNYAWSATAGGSDNSDVRVEKLCVPGGGTPTIDAKHYMFNGECTAMYERIDTWCSGDAAFCATSADNVTATVQRTVHGLVFARATSGGAPVALARQRASFHREGENAAAFRRINRNTTRALKFQKSISLAPGSFNWVYVNEDELGFYHTGLFPRRAPGVDFDMPSWGTGEWEWEGFLGFRDRPNDIDPERGYMTSWNNKPAKAWPAADSNYSFGPVHRVDSLDDRLEAALADGAPITVGQMVEMMGDAAHTDLRGSQVLPLALRIIGDEPALTDVLALLGDWVDAGAFRRDRDDDGEYDHSTQVALMDEWWVRMIDATVGPQLAPFYSSIPMGFDNRPGDRGSAYQSGYYGYLNKLFRALLGDDVTAPYRVLRCADGTLAGCRAALVTSLNDTVAALTSRHGSADPADWRADPEPDRIEFQPFGLAEVAPMHWQNRPTYQQVVQVRSRRPR